MKRNVSIALIGASLVLLAALFRAQFVFSIVDGASMQPTLRTGDMTLTWKSAYRQRPPRRGEIVVARYRGEWIIKRVLGLPGEEVEIEAGRLVIDGKRTDEPYAVEQGTATVGKGRLGPGRFAVYGDNRALDPARTTAAVVAREDIVGKVVLWWSWGFAERGL